MSVPTSFPLGTARRMSPLKLALALRNPTDLLTEIAAWPGDVAQAQIGRQSIAVLKHPDLVQQLLVADSARVEKGRTFERALFFLFLGDGLLNSKGETHRRQRRLMLPAFHRSRIAGYGRAMVAAATATAEPWRDGEIRDLNAEMMALTLNVVGCTLFSSGGGDTARSISDAFGRLTAHVNRLAFPGAKWLLRTPLPFARRLRDAERLLNDTVLALIREHRERGEDTGDLLSMLLLTEDSERPGEHLSDAELRDQVMTLFFAGHETTANALTWTLWLLAQHPEAEATLHVELDRVIGGRAPAFEDVPRLVFTEQIVRETLRLYPPVWAIGRRTLADLTFNGLVVSRNSLVVASQWISHRDARWYPEPDAFRPARWTPEFRTALPRFAYYPFGGGPRSCIGENFAWTELVLIVATLAQRWRFAATSTTQKIRQHARITLHPDREVRLQLHRRAQA
jgi:cytochrome P450